MLTLGAALASPASAGDALFAPQPNAASRGGACGPGPGRFQIKGSTACARITGYVAADENFRLGRSVQTPFAPDVRLGGASGGDGRPDAHFDRAGGLGRFHAGPGRE